MDRSSTNLQVNLSGHVELGELYIVIVEYRIYFPDLLLTVLFLAEHWIQ
jgi:hypothetical protein